jgi:hypothetical protein
MRAYQRPEQIRRSASHALNHRPPPQPRRALPPEAPSRLAQQVAAILQRIRAEGRGRVDHVRRGR